MLLLLFAGTLSVLLLASFGFLFVVRLRTLQSARTSPSPVILPGRYQPMLRLLSDGDFSFIAANPRLQKTLRAQRRRLFRDYLRCLARDYGSLLDGLRHAMVQSGVDRPDLAQALVRYRLSFTMALCSAEVRLALNAAGIGQIDISGLVAALDALRSQAGTFQPAPVAAH